jgi:hypothetical protein
MILRLSKYAWADYKGINIRMRTVFENDKNERWFIEITTGVVGENISGLSYHIYLELILKKIFTIVTQSRQVKSWTKWVLIYEC